MTYSPQDMIRLMAENWFLSEPVFYAVYCTQELRENARMACAVRCGQGRLEFNPLVLMHKSYAETEKLFRTEIIRLLMKHPYERRPQGYADHVIALGSDITIGDNYCFIHTKDKLPVQTPEAYHLPLGMHYEWYVRALSDQGNGSAPQATQQPDNKSDNTYPEDPSDDSQALADKSAMWQENEMERERINTMIERTTEWGSLPAELVEYLRVSARPKNNHRHLLQGFKAAVTAAECQLTRMRPNRRTGFAQMGRRRRVVTRILVAIDVSGSIPSELIGRFYALVNQLFTYGSAEIDVLTFDAEIQSVAPMTRRYDDLRITGRGGTRIEPVLDYLSAKGHYHGLIVLTDGQFPTNQLSNSKLSNSQILWVLPTEYIYQKAAPELSKWGRVTWIEQP